MILYYFQDHYNVLHIAAMYSREDVVKLLLNKRGVDSFSTGGVSILQSIFVVWCVATEIFIPRKPEKEKEKILNEREKKSTENLIVFVQWTRILPCHSCIASNYINKTTNCGIWILFFSKTNENKVENNQNANFYHSNTPIFIRRNVIYVFTFHNPFGFFQ